jgi:heat-inducible transcriptional repressor
MPYENLTEREIEILKALVNSYVTTAEPVGSRAIATKYKMGISPATIRNTLQDLEDLGLVEQPHTSAGRVPTDKGYRIYVDSLVLLEKLSETEEKRLREEIIVDYAAVDDLLEQTARILASISQQLGVTIAPRFDQGILTRIELIPVAEKKILVILAVKSGLIRTILLEADSPLTNKALEETARVLNERLGGLSLGEIKDSFSERIKETNEADPRLIKLFLDSTENILSFPELEQVHLGGTTNIVSQPEFKDRSKLKAFIEFLEEKKVLAELVSSQKVKEGITITIGKENERGEMQYCSIVTSTYKAGKSQGSIGVIGPTRMPYPKLISLVDYTAKLLSEILS